ncbi:MAG: MazG family protein [Deltaproteobacteria bacterium]|nr:MazG family protein [Deltaproteobacteria bacterium]
MAEIQELLKIMAQLRDPEGGCPWDLEQTFESISPHTIEEAYEVDEAIAAGDLEALRDELGDLLFQVVFQARLAEECGAFDFSDVIAAIVGKLVRRHPHVFAGAEVPESAEDQRGRWEEIKAAERAQAAAAGEAARDPFHGVPRRLPALVRSAKLMGRIERLRTQRAEPPERALASPATWVDERDGDPLAELGATLAELRTGLVEAGVELGDSAPEGEPDPAAARDALGRLVGRGIREWVRLARRLGIDAEQALRSVDDEMIARALSDEHQAGRSTRR